jgi:phosphomethylpyrimidine synthase
VSLITELKKGRIPKQIKEIASVESVDTDVINEKVIEGKIVIPKNEKKGYIKAIGIGYPLKTKVNANIGTSTDQIDVDLEVKKAIAAEEAGADTIMDLSTGGDLSLVRREIIKNINIPLGTVPIYQAAIETVSEKGGIIHMTEDKIFEVIEEQAKDGVDFMTLHCGVTLDTFERLKIEGRVMDVVSRGGTFLLT